MASWKKVILSGSNAELNSLIVNSGSITAKGIINDSEVGNSHITGSFTGSFVGDGSNLTGLPAAAISSYTNSGNNRVITSVDSSTVNGEANLTFDGSVLTVTGRINSSGPITGSRLQLSGITAGTDNTVLIVDANGDVYTDEIDSRVWGATLVDNAGGSSAADRVAVWSDSDSLQGDANFTFSSNVLTVNNSTFGDDVTIAGNLTVLGDTFQQQVTNVNVEDRFILLNSGSASGDGGIIIQTEAGFTGAALGWDDSATRFSLQIDTKLAATATTIAPDAYVAAVVDVDGGLSDISAHQVNGNIKIENGEIFIYS